MSLSGAAGEATQPRPRWRRGLTRGEEGCVGGREVRGPPAPGTEGDGPGPRALAGRFGVNMVGARGLAPFRAP